MTQHPYIGLAGTFRNKHGIIVAIGRGSHGGTVILGDDGTTYEDELDQFTPDDPSEARRRLTEQRDALLLTRADALTELDRLTAENEGLRARLGRTDITRDAYEALIADDGAWLLSHPRTLERDHILAVLTWSIQALYGKSRPDIAAIPTPERSES